MTSRQDLRGIELRVGPGQDRDLSGQQADFHFGDAIQASEVLLHPIGSEVSGHALDAQVDALDRGI